MYSEGEIQVSVPQKSLNESFTATSRREANHPLEAETYVLFVMMTKMYC
jgi:hypothetical protein